VFEINPVCDLKLIRSKTEEGGALNIHVTDVVKFRGPTVRDGPGRAPQLPLILDGPDPERMIDISVKCLAEELRLLDPFARRGHTEQPAINQINIEHEINKNISLEGSFGGF
jgi:hypothetical protein